jgi:hypothetical protein
MISPSGDTATPEGLAEEAKAERVHKGGALSVPSKAYRCLQVKVLSW